MSKNKLFRRYSEAIVAKEITRTEVCEDLNFWKQALSKYEKTRFKKGPDKFYARLDIYLDMKGIKRYD